ncbi:MAG: beta-ketoacyl-ACP synthase II [Spirochaetia bacterium]
MEKRRIVVTGMGALSSLGKTLQSTWDGLKEGKCGIGPITLFDIENHGVKIAAEVKGFNPGDYMSDKEYRKMARFTAFACAAAKMAVEDAKLTPDQFDPKRVATILGVGIGGLDEIENGDKVMYTRGPMGVHPLLIPRLISNEAPGNVAMMFNFQGPCLCITTACASGTDAIVCAGDAIRSGRADVVITGGVEAAVTGLSLAGFTRLTALTTAFNDDPQRASRPFDKDRSGFVMGEGAGILVLEEYEHAKRRGANIICEYAGGSMTCDAYHLTSPAPDARGAIEAFQLCLKDAGMKPQDVDYINAHGTSTPVNDPAETYAIKHVFGDHARKLKISSTKSMMGHTLGAAGGLEAIVSIMAMKDSFVPPTINLDTPDPDCDLDYTPHKGVKANLDVVMSDSLGFGGHNSVVCFKKFKE